MYARMLIIQSAYSKYAKANNAPSPIDPVEARVLEATFLVAEAIGAVTVPVALDDELVPAVAVMELEVAELV